MDQFIFLDNEICRYSSGHEQILPHHKSIMICVAIDTEMIKLPPHITRVVCKVNCKLDFLTEHVEFLFLDKKFNMQLEDALSGTFLKTLAVKNEFILKKASLPKTLITLCVNMYSNIDIEEFNKSRAKVPIVHLGSVIPTDPIEPKSPETPKIPDEPKMIDHEGNLRHIPAKRYKLLCKNTESFPATEYKLVTGKVCFKKCDDYGNIGIEYESNGIHLIEDIIDESDRTKVMGWLDDKIDYIVSLKY